MLSQAAGFGPGTQKRVQHGGPGWNQHHRALPTGTSVLLRYHDNPIPDSELIVWERYPIWLPNPIPLNAVGMQWKPHAQPSARVTGPVGKMTVILSRTDKIRRRKLQSSWMWKSGCRPEGLLTAGSLCCDIIELCEAHWSITLAKRDLQCPHTM